MAGGGSKSVQSLLKKSSILGGKGVPYRFKHSKSIYDDLKHPKTDPQDRPASANWPSHQGGAGGCTDMIFVNFFTRPKFLRPEFYPKKRVNCDNGKFTTKQRKYFKMTNLLQKHVKCSKITFMADILWLTIYFHETKAFSWRRESQAPLLKPGCHQRVTLVGSC